MPEISDEALNKLSEGLRTLVTLTEKQAAMVTANQFAILTIVNYLARAGAMDKAVIASEMRSIGHEIPKISAEMLDAVERLAREIEGNGEEPPRPPGGKPRLVKG